MRLRDDREVLIGRLSAMSASSHPRVVLAGPPGSGKSTVAAEIGAVTGWSVRDTDADVEVLAGKSVSDIVVEDGEDAFRTLERRAVATALGDHPADRAGLRRPACRSAAA